MNSLQIKEFQKAIDDFVEKSLLPAEVKRMVLERILEKVETTAIEEIRQEIIEREEKEKQQQEEKTKKSK